MAKTKNKCSSCKAYKSPRISSEQLDCSLPLTFDQYSQCAYGCLYCFSFYQKSNNPSIVDKSIKAVSVSRMDKFFKGQMKDNPYYRNFIVRRHPFHWGGLADPFCDIEKRIGTGLEIIKSISATNYPCIFSTKGTLMVEKERYHVFKKARKNKNFAFQFSIITADEEDAKRVEVGTPSVKERIDAMAAMSELGYWTILRLRPYIIGISDKKIDKLIKMAAEAGARAVSMEFFCLDVRQNDNMKKRYKLMSDIAGFNIPDYYRVLSPSERGGYRRLNYDLKYNYVKQVMDLCKKYNLQFNISDPDYKECNQSGCCCGLPNTREDLDSDLVNWSRSQMTEVLRKKRLEFLKHQGQKHIFITFEDCVNGDDGKWRYDGSYIKDSLKLWGVGMFYKYDDMDYLKETRGVWNSLASYSNPINYFFGRLAPAGFDKNGDAIFEYLPNPFDLETIKGITKS